MPATRSRVIAGLLSAFALLTACGDLDAASAQGITRNDLVAEMIAQLSASGTMSYSAGYQLAGGRTGTVTQSQKPPRIAYEHAGGRPETVTEVREAGMIPAATVLGLLDAAALDQTVSVTARDTTIAGQHATCLDLAGVDEAAASAFSTCVTSDGVLGSFRGTVSGSPIDMTMTTYERW